MLKNTQLVADNECLLVFKDQKIEQVLTVGSHKFWAFDKRREFVRFDMNECFFSADNAARMYRNSAELRKHVVCYQTEKNQAGMLLIDGSLRCLVSPNETLYLWKGSGDIEFITIDIESTLELSSELMDDLQRAGSARTNQLYNNGKVIHLNAIKEWCVSDQFVGLLFIDGQYIRSLAPGRYGFWRFFKNIEVKQFDCRTQMLDISGQEILSKDRVSLRVNLSASTKLVDVELAASSVANIDDYSYKLLQLALREAVGTKTLDELLQDKAYINKTVKELVVDQLAAVGVELQQVGVKDIILPGEMKAILNQVVEAQKSAEANVIKRREETSATRSLNNTAKVMENNPTLMRLKELEALEKIAGKINSLTVYGGLEGLMKGSINLNPEQ